MFEYQIKMGILVGRKSYGMMYVLVFGFNRSLFSFDKKRPYHWWNEIYWQRERDIQSAKTEL